MPIYYINKVLSKNIIFWHSVARRLELNLIMHPTYPKNNLSGRESSLVSLYKNIIHGRGRRVERKRCRDSETSPKDPPVGAAFCQTPIYKLSFPKNLGLPPAPRPPYTHTNIECIISTYMSRHLTNLYFCFDFGPVNMSLKIR